ncbi:MAG: HAMP domain-containing sensor histidine kinase [Pirellulales bacterium]
MNQSPTIGNRMPSVYPSPPTRNAHAQSVPVQNSVSAAGERSSGWTTWYHQRGLVLSYWMRYENQSIAMVIVPRGRWLSDIVSNLPNSETGLIDTNAGTEASPAALSHSLIQLRDVEGGVIYQWGDSSLSDSEIIDSEIGVTPPLEGWRFRLILSPESRSAVSQTQSRRLARLGTAGLACALLALGILTTVNLNRQMRIAAQQVTFVNQVSHELRTPLTNIRMVADLASASLHRTQIEDELNSDLQRLTIIQQEAGRLGRLVENVLAFARAGRNLSPLHIREVDVESTIDEVLRSFEPQLSEQHMEVIRMRGLSDRLMLDRDVLERILVNLISNAIKYAAIGKQLTVVTRMQDGRVEIEIVDQGPGIPRRMRSKVFQPFVRLSHRLEDPAGTGIGLTIVRQLAKRHGGDCRLQPSAKGCRFVVTLKPQLSA